MERRRHHRLAKALDDSYILLISFQLTLLWLCCISAVRSPQKLRPFSMTSGSKDVIPFLRGPSHRLDLIKYIEITEGSLHSSRTYSGNSAVSSTLGGFQSVIMSINTFFARDRPFEGVLCCRASRDYRQPPPRRSYECHCASRKWNGTGSSSRLFEIY